MHSQVPFRELCKTDNLQDTCVLPSLQIGTFGSHGTRVTGGKLAPRGLVGARLATAPRRRVQVRSVDILLQVPVCTLYVYTFIGALTNMFFA